MGIKKRGYLNRSSHALLKIESCRQFFSIRIESEKIETVCVCVFILNKRVECQRNTSREKMISSQYIYSRVRGALSLFHFFFCWREKKGCTSREARALDARVMDATDRRTGSCLPSGFYLHTSRKSQKSRRLAHYGTTSRSILSCIRLSCRALSISYRSNIKRLPTFFI